MQARKTLFAFILVVSALAGLASAAPTPDSDTPNNPDSKPHAVNQLACNDQEKPPPKKRGEEGTPEPKPHAVNQLACGGDAKTDNAAAPTTNT
ncbi:hypothetical protein PTTG_12397 [Puccinia triticina 1-1 BBBD Race 1]|uniref:Secreted protein n=2 Tax=Puccinia triticina TaxID=208348 RepID=A0A180GLN1_PUCT1|nr:uncharacterized protein PtA15_7A302 [Puccinia triticina]OAV93666.1 hypothetical protein PTTG_12397 [Puccinia triticina 1-1 BBBD Race 1]WAQ86576.1 hypothetical protein PtA15_7A302 [Puccinia triticina]